MASKTDHEKKEPLLRPATVRAFAATALAVMALSVVIDAVHGHVGHFGVDGILGAYAVLGLLSGLIIIAVAKGLGVPLSRPDTYYGEGEKEADK